MCGIAGIVDSTLDRADLVALVEQMTESLVHRGPDEGGHFIGDGVALGARRLSIIDVRGGRQPIDDESRQIHVVLNGEIYNYRDLRSELERRGHRFRTRSDTETVVHAYEEDQDGFASKLRGMFALAVWDERRKRLVLVRDRLGKKPLYYAHYDERLLFGSEIKALLAADPGLAEANRDALPAYLSLGFVSDPGTMFRRIRKLPPAQQLIYENGEVTIRKYWSLDFDQEEVPRDAHLVADELAELLDEAVRIRLMSEVPLGVFLSGGLDSSTIVALAQKADPKPLKTFTVGFDRKEWDESEDARLVADHCGTDHHVLTLHDHDLSANLPATVLALVRSFDEPFVDSSALPTYFISQLAREHVTVILSGDGGDELLAGYTAYRGLQFAQHYRRLPTLLRRSLPLVANAIAALFPRGHRYGIQRAARILQTSSLRFDDLYFSKITLCSPQRLQQILTPEFFRSVNWMTSVRPSQVETAFASNWPELVKMSYADLRFRLVEDMLVKVDRMSMAHSLEVRSPFLDHHLVEFVFKLPPSLKLRRGRSKAILRDAMRPYLPPQTLRKPKQGFSIPLRAWLRGELYEMTRDYLTSDGCLPLDIFDRSGVHALLSEHVKGKADHSAVIWALLSFATWEEAYLKGKQASA
jgi:asparagine synthase (glutamine-hydrolysing)